VLWSTASGRDTFWNDVMMGKQKEIKEVKAFFKKKIKHGGGNTGTQVS
jgi:hypothetical protein